MFVKADVTFILPYAEAGASDPHMIGVQVNIEDDTHGTLPVSYQLAGSDLEAYQTAENKEEFFGLWLKKQVKMSYDTWCQGFTDPAPETVLPSLTALSITDIS